MMGWCLSILHAPSPINEVKIKTMHCTQHSA